MLNLNTARSKGWKSRISFNWHAIQAKPEGTFYEFVLQLLNMHKPKYYKYFQINDMKISESLVHPDGFEEDTALRFSFFDLTQFTEVRFLTPDDILFQIGGTMSAIFTMVFILSYWFIKREFKNNLLAEIQGHEQDTEIFEGLDKQCTLEQIQDRVSFKSIYQMHDQIATLENQL